MSMAADYRKEREGIETIETDNGFITFKFFKDECYIVDIYVKPELRRSRVGSQLADWVTAIAKQRECKILTGSADSRLFSATDSVRALLAYGFRVLRVDGAMIWFVKEVQ